MTARLVGRLQEFLEGNMVGNLRSIISYEDGEIKVEYLRDDVAKEYDEPEIAAAVSESVMDSMTVPIYENVFSEDHGDLICLVQYFENVIEMNFALGDGKGVAVAIDEDETGEMANIVSQARQLVSEEREYS